MPTPITLQCENQLVAEASPIKESLEPPPVTNEAARLAERAEKLGAVYMLPAQEHDGPLTESDILPRSGEPVVHDGFDYSQASRRYLEEIGKKVLHEPAVQESKGSELRELYRGEKQAQMAFNFALLLAHDKGIHRSKGFARFEHYVSAELGEKMSRSTIYRRLAHMKWALILAAAGYIDSLPSQEACAVMSELPRSHWIPMLRHARYRCGARRLSEQCLKALVPEYAARHHLPLRGQKLELPAPLPQLAEESLTTPSVVESAEPEPALSSSETRKAAEKAVIERLKAELPLLLKAAKWRKLQKKSGSSARWCLAKLGSIGKKSRKTNEVTRGKQLFSILDEAYPELATAIRDSMCAHLIEQLERMIR